MKKIISILLVMIIASSMIVPAFAAGGFDKSVFENSRNYSSEGFNEWCLSDYYRKQFTDATITVYSILWGKYVKEGWGPELRIFYYDPYSKTYDEVTAFRACIDDKLFYFEDLGQGVTDDGDAYGFVFGGTVYKAFLKALIGAKKISFQFDHIDFMGDMTTHTIDHVHTGDVSPLVGMAQYLFKSNAFSTDTNPEASDKNYGAYIG